MLNIKNKCKCKIEYVEKECISLREEARGAQSAAQSYRSAYHLLEQKVRH